jgi:hypothetical protein
VPDDLKGRRLQRQAMKEHGRRLLDAGYTPAEMRAAAARMADASVREMGKRWADVMEQAEQEEQ